MNRTEEIERRIAYLKGRIDGITLYAIWRDGKQLVGITMEPLSEAVAEERAELNRLNEALRESKQEKSKT